MKATVTRDGFELEPENDGDRLALNEFRKKVKEPHIVSVMAYMHSCTSFWVTPLAEPKKGKRGLAGKGE